MRKHIPYFINGAMPAPAGHGDARSWFLYYKFNTDGPVYVPGVASDAGLAEAAVGDVLWFVLDDYLMGAAEIVRTVEDPMNDGRLELWYDAEKIVRASEPTLYPLGWTQEEMETWLNAHK